MRATIMLAALLSSATIGMSHPAGAALCPAHSRVTGSASARARMGIPTPAARLARRIAIPGSPLGRQLWSPTTVLAPSPCPMAHCDRQMSDDEAIIIPTASVSRTWQFTATDIAPGGLGCTVSTTDALCVFTSPSGSHAYDRPYMYALDPTTGAPLWNSGTSVNSSVMYGVPLADADGNSYVSDDNYLVSWDASGTLRWRVPNPAQAAMVSFNLTHSGYLVGQGRKGSVVVVDPTDGHVTGSLLLTATISGTSGTFITLNTVSVLGNRVYTVTQFCPLQVSCGGGTTVFSMGRLYAIDIVAGVPHIAWHWDFAGPSGASPLTISGTISPTIYFDGSGLTQGDPHHPWLFAVQDRGSSATVRWAVDFTTTFGSPYARGILASPALDPRGGLWEWTSRDSRLFRFDALSGTPLQTIDVSTTPGLSGYDPSSAMSIAVNGGNPVMLLGVANLVTTTAPSYLLALDLVSSRLLWEAADTSASPYYCQFPISQIGTDTIVIAARKDQPIFGFTLQ